MTTNQVGSVDENWMIEAAAEAAPPLASEQIDQLRRVLATPQPVVTQAAKFRPRKATGSGRRAA